MPFKPLLRAFPSVLVRDSRGMLLRDYFASDIASGYVRFMGCDPDARGQICEAQNADNNAEAIARSAYKVADAMLIVREEKQEPTIAPGTLVETGSEE